MCDPGLVSIITPAHNSEKTIESCINSVLGQTYNNWEHIIIDDCSTDSTSTIAKNISNGESRIKYVKLPDNQGSGKARNKGIQLAKGRFIAFLDSDDIWLPQKLEIQLKFIRDNNLFFTYSSYFVNNNSTISLFRVKEQLGYKDLLKTCWIGCLTVIYDVEKIGKYYMPPIKKAQDYVTWLNILKDHGNVTGINVPLAQYNINAGSNSYNKINALKYQWYVYRRTEGLNFYFSLYFLLFYAFFGLRKKIKEKIPYRG